MTSAQTTAARAEPLGSTVRRAHRPSDLRQPPAEVTGHPPRRTAADYPLARWYLRPLASGLARRLSASSVRPWHLTACGLAAAVAAAAVLAYGAAATPYSGGLVLLAWFFDRADGLLARQQGSASRWGAWLDANVDELVDMGLHIATAAAVAHWSGSSWPWALLLAFIAGKYLLMHGLMTEGSSCHGGGSDLPDGKTAGLRSWMRWAYHLPANSDVRIHLLALALLSGWLTAELCLIAVYYNIRWAVRYFLVARRLAGVTS